jgi:hypothetical protein
MNMRNILGLAAASVVGLVSIAGAGSISTGIADWKFVSYNDLGSGPGVSDAVRVATNSATGNSAAILASPNAGWTGGAPLVADGAKWISALSTGATTGMFGLYTYELELNLAPGSYQIDGRFTSDNLVESLVINGTEKLTGYAGPSVFSFQSNFVVPTTVTSAPIVIRAVVYNTGDFASVGQWGDRPVFTGTSATGTSNPTGFILSGEAVIIPLPAAAWAGIALLGVGGIVRRRVMTA